MSSRTSRPSTTITSSVEVEKIDDGTVTGVSIGEVKGDVVYSAPPYIEAPNPKCVAHYLEQKSADTLPPAEAVPAVRRLWEQPFRAKRPGAVEADLYQMVQEIFGQDRKIARIQRVVVLADAGMGKTPALRYLATKRAKQSLRNYRSYLTRLEKSADATLNKDTFIVPLLIRLGDLHAGLSISALVRDAFNACILPGVGVDEITADQVPQLLAEYKCLFLLDDLDELFSYDHKCGLQAISQFMETHPGEQYVISCRKPSYREQLGPIDALYLDDLTDKEAKYVLGAERYGQLNPSLRQLARNRAMLNILLELLEQDSSTKLLVSKGQLYQRRTHQCLRPDKPDSKDRAYVEMAEGVLECLAYSMQRDHTHSYSERQVMEVVRRYLEEWHEPYTWREVVNALCHKYGILRRDGLRQWRFCDRSTEAYFAAAAVLQEPIALQPILEEVSDYWWRDMFEILVGLVSEPADLLFELIDRDALVAANCIQFVGRAIDDWVTDTLIDALIERMSQESSSRRKYIVERIGESDHPRALQALLLALHREWSSMVVMAIAKSVWGWTKRHPEFPIKEEEKKILQLLPRQAESVAELLQMHDEFSSQSNESRLIELLNDPAQPPKIRGLAAIGLGFIDTETARAALLDLLVDQHADDFVAWCGVESLTRVDHPDVQKAAIKLYEGEEYEGQEWVRHRARAIYLLGWVGSDPNTNKLLSKAIEQDPNFYVRGYAINAMVRLDFPNAREQIEQSLATEQEPWVLRKAAEALGEIGTVQSITVLERHLRHERTRTRWMVRRAIDEIRQRYAL